MYADIGASPPLFPVKPRTVLRADSKFCSQVHVYDTYNGKGRGGKGTRPALQGVELQLNGGIEEALLGAEG